VIGARRPKAIEQHLAHRPETVDCIGSAESHRQAGTSSQRHYLNFYLLSHLYALIVHTISENKRLLLESSCAFQEIVTFLKTRLLNAPCKDQAKHIFFTMKHAAKMVHHSEYKYHSNKTM
jgi:uncharacterized protein (DUF111 family)